MRVYRFRKCDFRNDTKNPGSHLQSELEKSEIYFSKLSQLNDPMEGLKDIYFKGDIIIWKNFFRNYIINLLLSFTTSMLDKDNVEIIVNTNPKLFDIHRQLCKNFICIPTVANLINEIKNKRIDRDELWLYLSICHTVAIKLVLNMLKDKRLIKKVPEFSAYNYDNIQWKGIIVAKRNKKEKFFANFCGLIQGYQSDSMLSGIPNNKRNILSKLFVDYPRVYLERLESLMYPECYSASFSKSYDNSSMWGIYADAHTGVCLEFTTEDSALPIYTCCGISSSGNKIYDWRAHKLRQIVYKNRSVSFNFFENIGFISTDSLYKLWYIDPETKEHSSCNTITEKNRLEYIERGMKAVNRKMKDWAFEKEYRIIIQSFYQKLENQSDRILKYRFDSLSGIIFGIRTSESDKRRIIEIISNKCKLNGIPINKFKFFQAYYNKRTGKIDRRHMIIKHI